MILETAVNTTRQSRNRTQTSFNAEGAEQRGGEEHFLSPFSAFLSESLRLCVNSSQPASKSGYSRVEAGATYPADLFNKARRRRGSRFDCLIAAAAMLAQAEIATINQSDFKPFMHHGLTLAVQPPLPPSTTPQS